MTLAILFQESVGWVLRFGGPGILALGVVHSFVPIPGGLDLLTILLSARYPDWWWYYAGMALTGDMIGSYLNYRIARKGGKEAVKRKIPKQKAEKAFDKFEKFGTGTLLLGSLMPPPMPWIPFLAAAGAMQYPVRKFLAVIAVGRGTRFFALAWVGQRYGRWIINLLSSYRQEILYTLLALGVAIAVGLLVYFKWYRPRRRQED